MSPSRPPAQAEKLSGPINDAWRAAEAAGVDMSLLEHSLSLSAWERLVEHQRALELAEMLQTAKIKPSCPT